LSNSFNNREIIERSEFTPVDEKFMKTISFNGSKESIILKSVTFFRVLCRDKKWLVSTTKEDKGVIGTGAM